MGSHCVTAVVRSLVGGASDFSQFRSSGGGGGGGASSEAFFEDPNGQTILD